MLQGDLTDVSANTLILYILFLIAKTNNFRGNLTDVAAKTLETETHLKACQGIENSIPITC